MTDNLPPLPKPDTHCFDSDTEKDVWSHSAEQMQAYARAAIEARAAVPAGWVMVPQPLIDTFPEINPSNYDHDDACELNRWGCEVVTTAVAAPQPVAQPKCPTCNDNGLIGGPSFSDPGESGAPCPACSPEKPMTAHRAAYFMRRFQHEEKLLGPNEQAALKFTIEALEAMEAQPVAQPSEPVDMVLHCPACGMQHIDAPEERSAVLPRNYGHWSNPPHRSHLCHGCGHIWRPADVPTNGVAAVKTTGKQDSPVQQASEVEKFMDAAGLCRRCAAPTKPASDEEAAVIRSLLDLARQVDHALDDSEEVNCDGYRSHNIAGQDFDDVVEALDALEDLPDDKPGVTLGSAGKAEWALRRLLQNL